MSDIIHFSTFLEISKVPDNEIENWFNGYLTTLLQRDVRALSEIEKPGVVPKLKILATRAGRLINDANIARDAGLNTMTSRNYKTLLKIVFLTFELPPWYRNLGKRFVKSSKRYLIDTLLLCYLLEYNLEYLEKKQT